jgi:hypothetical protein
MSKPAPMHKPEPSPKGPGSLGHPDRRCETVLLTSEGKEQEMALEPRVGLVAEVDDIPVGIGADQVQVDVTSDGEGRTAQSL